MNKNTEQNLVVGNLATLMENTDFSAAMTSLRHPHGWFRSMHEFGRFGETGYSTLVILAVENGAVIGQVLVDKTKRCGIFVHPDHRRVGVGSLLLQQAYECVGEGMRCRPDDEGGIKFFREHELTLHLYINEAFLS